MQKLGIAHQQLSELNLRVWGIFSNPLSVDTH